MQEEVPCIARLLKAYLAVPEARRVISGPLKANLSEALGQMAAVVFREYTAEEADAMALMSPDEVKHALALLD